MSATDNFLKLLLGAGSRPGNSGPRRQGGAGSNKKKPQGGPKKGANGQKKTNTAKQDKGNNKSGESASLAKVASLLKMICKPIDNGNRAASSNILTFSAQNETFIETRSRSEVGKNARTSSILLNLPNPVRKQYKWVEKEFPLSKSNDGDTLQIKWKGEIYHIVGDWEPSSTFSMYVENEKWKVIYLEEVTLEESSKWYDDREIMVNEAVESLEALEKKILNERPTPEEEKTMRKELALKLERKACEFAANTSGLISCKPCAQNAELGKGLVSATDLRLSKNYVKTEYIEATRGGQNRIINGDTLGLHRKLGNPELVMKELSWLLNVFFCANHPHQILSIIGPNKKLNGDNLPLFLASASHHVAKPGETGLAMTSFDEPLSLV